ncbi:MAG: hypothetical protein R3F29_06075 [Planctomycetota bacterium]
MNEAEQRQLAEQRRLAEQRELEALLEQELGAAPPIEAILARAAAVSTTASRRRMWLVAALLLLGIGVTFALAWQQRAADGGRDASGVQEPDVPIEQRWPDEVPRVYRPEQFAEVPEDTRVLGLAMPVHEAAGLERFDALDQLDVHLTPKTIGRLVRDGEPETGSRLDRLRSVPTLRRLKLWMVPVAPADLRALRGLERLQVLELSGPLEIDDALRQAAQQGGAVPPRVFDAEFGAAIAAHSRARTLAIEYMQVTAAGLRALADGELHTLRVDVTAGVTADALEALGELRQLRHLELHGAHGVSIASDAGGQLTAQGSPVLSREVLHRLAALPSLQSLTLDACVLDGEALKALPRSLQRLDLATCFGVDASLGAVIAEMRDLVELGLPLRLDSDEDYRGMWSPRIHGTDLHTRRLTGAEAAAIVAARPWHWLHFDGRLDESMTNALTDQPLLRELTLTPTAGSVPMTFAGALPQLRKVTFVDADISHQLVEPLGESRSLREVVFDDCTSNRVVGGPVMAIPEGVAVRKVKRMAW